MEEKAKEPRHKFYLELATGALEVFNNVKELRKAVARLDQSQIRRVIKGKEKSLRTETRLMI